ncbi:hypothetical protein IGI04_026131 [Brassica rapa subsp. trilocularis]|uniref:Uncharacterized protein n=1 Tax=Brassica rapa subsp. trilocularis TaxID=1813537 RepID=A0ABQ7KVE5_BRACM|nr:hypothetical protein IGI04_026131 [Brassica rapa subsp. trilocularis]
MITVKEVADSVTLDEKFVRIFVEANQPRKITITNIVRVSNANQVAQFLEVVREFLAEGNVIPDVIDVAETNTFNLTSQWYDWGSEDPFYGLPHEDPKDLIKRLEELASANNMSQIIDFIYSEENGDIGTPTTHVKQPDIQVHHADESKQKDELNREKLVNHDTVKDDEYHVSEEQSKVEEADTKDPTSASIDSSNSESIDSRTSETFDTNICHRSIPSTIPDATTVIEEVDISDMSSEPIDTPTSTSIDIPTVTSIDPSLQTSIDTNSCCQPIPLEIPEKSSCPQDIADSTLKSIDVSSCYPDQKVEKEITMEDFLELEEFLELEDGQQLGDLDSSEEVTMEDFLELEEWLGDLDQKFDDQHTLGKGLENSLKADNIDRHKPDKIDRHPPYDIDLQSPSNIDQHTPDCIYRRPPNCIERHSCLDELSGYPIEPGTIEEIMHMSKTSHIDVPEHRRPPICAEEAVGICKRVKRIHDPVKIMVPCAVFEVESPIPPDKGVYLSSYIEVLNDQHHVEAHQRGLRFRDEWRNSKKKKRINEGSQLSLIPHFSDDARRSRVQGKDPRKTSFHRNRRWLANIDRQSIKGIDRHLTVLVNIHIKSASQEEAAEKRKPRRSMQHPARRSMEIPDRGPCIFYDCVKPRSHKLPECPWTTRNSIYVIFKPLLTARNFLDFFTLSFPFFL